MNQFTACLCSILCEQREERLNGLQPVEKYATNLGLLYFN